ncbi:zinc finger protein 845-like [Actinia tenebrosa]|uniref:Zinc finger protein 845-like n=1 Tax=Actinia tenebrosa TaxID=6105 RepID=A0A6P8H5J4_ACTTE|nr:zinc finger protein 845-like [Actinia tenebrosa]
MECMQCNKSFSSKQRLQYHLSKKVCQKTVSTLCGDCGRELSTLQALQYHRDNRVCLKNCCRRCDEPFFEGNWHKYRCRRYHLDGITCETHGDIAERCCPLETSRALTKRKKEIDQTFVGFDDVEGVRWEDREHWEAICDRCGCQRSGQHIWCCLYDGPRPLDHYLAVRKAWKKEKDI